MKVPLLSLFATETEELKESWKRGKKETTKEKLGWFQISELLLSNYNVIHLQFSSIVTQKNNFYCYSRHYLCVVNQVLQRVAAGEVIVEICGVADQPLVRSEGFNVSCDDN